MKVLKEITVWDMDYQPNHTYLIEGDRVVAYKPKHGSEIRKSNIKISTSKRKFQEIPYRESEWGIRSTLQTVRVEGSKGSNYTVTLGEKPSCDCTGFKFRGDCKHIKQVMEQSLANN